MNWSRTDSVATYKLFKQKAKMHIDVHHLKKGKQVPLLMTGVNTFNSWELSMEEAKNPEVLCNYFDKPVELHSSFRIEQLST